MGFHESRCVVLGCVCPPARGEDAQPHRRGQLVKRVSTFGVEWVRVDERGRPIECESGERDDQAEADP